MIELHSTFSKDATSMGAASTDLPRNWRSELGTSWRNIEEAGSVAKAIRLRSPAGYVTSRNGATATLTGEGSVKASCWAYFRTLCSGIF